ncbi:MAG: putative patatin-like phospholipase [Aeromicrobium sp.]|nr:putative patatin-like phospholipase [Aeromicrobium sp.]
MHESSAPLVPTTPFTLVLGGGGVAGIAWETGVLAGLLDEGVDLTAAHTFLGTSAGATVAAQLTSGTGIEALFARQMAGVPYEITKELSGARLVKFFVAQLLPGSQQRASRRIGRLALSSDVGTLAERRGVIEARLPAHAWPDVDLRLVVVDAASGDERLVARADGIELIDAVAASCAVPMVWPPVPAQGRDYIDGGTRSPVNLDLAPGDGPVVAIAPTTLSFRRSGRIEEQEEQLAPRPVTLITMAPEVKTAQGRNPFDPAVVPPVAEAGRLQGRREAARVAAALSAA